MNELEQVFEIGNGSLPSIRLRFGKDVQVESGAHRVYIYSEDRRKRYDLLQIIDKEQNLFAREVGLFGETRRGTWHRLMEIGVARTFDQGEELNAWVAVGSIDGENDLRSDMTNGRQIAYSINNEGRKALGAGGGYYGPEDMIIADLKEMQALGLRAEQMPEQIDVRATMQEFINSFLRAEFVPPQFVLPETNVGLRERVRIVIAGLLGP